LSDLHLAEVDHEGLALGVVALAEDHVARVECACRDVANLTAHAKSFSCRLSGQMPAMGSMILRIGSSLGLVLLLRWAAPGPARAEGSRGGQRALLRARPGGVLIVSEVSSEGPLDCGAGPTKATPPVFRETGTGWFIDGEGWVITNGHVVQPAHETPRWLVN